MKLYPIDAYGWAFIIICTLSSLPFICFYVGFKFKDKKDKIVGVVLLIIYTIFIFS